MSYVGLTGNTGGDGKAVAKEKPMKENPEKVKLLARGVPLVRRVRPRRRTSLKSFLFEHSCRSLGLRMM